MRMATIAPSPRLAPLVRTFRVVETSEPATRTLVPDAGVIAGFRFGGSARELSADPTATLPDATLAGMRDTSRRMWTSAGGGVVLAVFQGGGAASVFDEPLHALFGRTVSLDELVPHAEVDRVATQVAAAADHRARVAVIEHWLLTRSATRAGDALVTSAARAIAAAQGQTRIEALAADLGVGQDRLEKRFRAAVGASPKQLATLLRLRRAVGAYRPGASLTRLSSDAGYFDQSHFIRQFRAVVGQAPGRFFRAGDYC